LLLYGVLAAVAIVMIIVGYALLLAKLKPTRESRSEPTVSGSVVKEKVVKKPETPEPPTTFVETNAIAKQQLAPSVQSQPVQDQPVKASQVEVQDEEEKAPRVIDKDKESKKSFLLFGKNDFEGCKHKFGHLGKLPKSTPIPEECFGCSQILECLVAKKGK
jgi:hypothetical protein